MSVVFQLKTIEAKKDIDVAVLIYNYSAFFDFLKITEKYRKITDINYFTSLVKDAGFSILNFGDFDELIRNLNSSESSGVTARKADFYINFLIDCLHYNYNIVLVNMSGNSSSQLTNLKAALKENDVKFIVYDPLNDSVAQAHSDIFIETKIPIVFNCVVNYPNLNATAIFIENEYINNRNIPDFTFKNCKVINGLVSASDNLKPFIFSCAGIKKIKRYYDIDDADGELSDFPYTVVSLVSDAAGSLSRSFIQYPWYSPAGLDRGKILNQNFTTDEGLIPITPTNLSGSASSDLGIAYSRGLNTFLKIPSGTNVNEYFLLSDYCGITQSATPVKTSISYGNLISYISYGVKTVLNGAIFEINDSVLRNSIKFRIEDFLQPIRSNQGIDDFRVVCDESNNSETDILNRKLSVDVYIKPSQTINFVELSFTT